MDKAQKKLKKYFGYNNFYPFQENVIKELLNNKDIFVLAKTSGGKSICYQLPALIFKGITIVISPLRSLIEDQINNLKKKNIKCLSYYGDLDKQEKNVTMNILENGDSKKYKILYTTPETLELNIEFFQILKNLYEKKKLARFVIDEAHTVSIWGHNFRKSYLKLSNLKKIFIGVPITALTATATYYIQKDILKILQIEDAVIIRDKLYRENLYIDIRLSNVNKNKEIVSLITDSFYKKTGIIYCLTQQTCENYSKFLVENGINSNYYHANLSKDERKKIQIKWINGEIDVIVATIAFGMGIDKSNVRFVIHYNTPASIENYYQEIGRAGRDNLPSKCILYYDNLDINIHKAMINSNKTLSCYQYKKYQLSKLEDLKDYLLNIHDCRHQLLCLNFGEKNKTPCLNSCTNCLHMKKNPLTFEFKFIAKQLIKIVNDYKLRMDKDTLMNKISNCSLFSKKFGNIKVSVLKRIFDFLILHEFIDLEILKLDNIFYVRYYNCKSFDNTYTYILKFFSRSCNKTENKIFNNNLENSDPNRKFIDIETPIL